MARKKKKATEEFCVYIGPNLKGLIQTGQVFMGDKEAAKQEAARAIEARPLIRHLIVSGSRLPEARREVTKPGTALYQFYRRLAAGE